MSNVKMREHYTGQRIAQRSIPLGGPLAKLDGLGRLTQYPAVAKLQALCNDVVTFSHRGSGTLTCQIPESYRTDDDGRWGDETQALFNKVVKYLTDGCGPTGLNPYRPSSYGSTVAAGPRGMEAMLVNGPSPFGTMTAAEVAECQTAWQDLRDAKSACAMSGGTWNSGTASCTAAAGGGGGLPPPPPPDEGDGDGNGGGGDGEPDVTPTPTKSGWGGLILLTIDAIGGAILAGSSKKW